MGIPEIHEHPHGDSWESRDSGKFITAPLHSFTPDIGCGSGCFLPANPVSKHASLGRTIRSAPDPPAPEHFCACGSSTDLPKDTIER